MRDPGRVQRAPENFLDAAQITEVQAGRRDFLRGAFVAAAALGAGRTVAAEAGDPAILNLPEHSRSLGQPGAAPGYRDSSPSEKNPHWPERPWPTARCRYSASVRP